MYLKSLTIKGFKSFAETTKIQLSPGVTVVVGPNGSGKSNIVDSIVWVLGAQGPRSLRSQKMEDVIFAGSNNRSGLGRAEVTLVIDNSDGTLPIPAAEVAITRSLSRSGESDYSINGSPARLVDLVDLLADAHVGRSQHVIIGQGQIDQMLSARPEERRAIIEEAAGVHKFRRRKERADRRLATSDGDVERASDVLREVRRQVKPIEKQAEAFLRHRELTTRQAELQAYLAGVTLNRARAQLEEAKKEASELKISVEGIRERARMVEQEVELQLPPITSVETEISGRRLEELHMRLAVVEAKTGERKRSISQRLADLALSSEMERSRQRTVRAKQELSEVIEAGEALIEEQEAYLSAEEELSESKVDVGRLTQLRLDHSETSATHARLLADISGQKASLVERRLYLSELEARIARVRQELAEIELELESLSSEALEAGEHADRALVDLTDALGRQEELVGNLRVQMSETKAEAAATAARVKALEAVLGEQRRRISLDSLADMTGVIGGLFELVGAQSGYERALEAALGPLSSAIMTTGIESAMDVRSYFAGQGHSFVALFASEHLESEGVGDSLNLPGEPLASKLIFADPRAKAAVLRHCRTIRVVDDLEQAVAAATRHRELQYVTKAGELVNYQSLILPGSDVSLPLSELLESRAYSEAAEQKLATLVTVCSEAEQSLAELRSKEKEASTLLARLNSESARRSGRLLDAEAQRVRLARELDELVTALANSQEDVRFRQERLELIEAECGIHLERLSALAEELVILEEQNSTYLSRRTAVETLKAEIRNRAASLEERKKAAERHLAEMVQAETELADLLSLQDTERAELKVELGLIDSKINKINQISGLLKSTMAMQQGLNATVVAMIDARLAQERRLSETRAKLSEELAQATSRMHEVDLLVTESRTRYTSTLERYIRDLQMTEAQLLSAPLPAVSSSLGAEAQLSELEAELSRLGPVNPHAASELEEAQARIGFLEGQLEDIRFSRRELAKVASQIEREMRSVFMIALEDVNRSFQAIFSQLFPGGSATVVLLDTENPLQSGIDFELSIPAKKVRRMSLLSGGERSMVALAFLFAIFQSRPAPFVILDEVEAALDDKNLARFLGLLEHFRTTAQLLVISHQKRTMEVADVLLGATMDKSGTTKVVREEISKRLPLAIRTAE